MCDECQELPLARQGDYISKEVKGLLGVGEDRDEAVARATDALEEAIAARIHDGKDIPQPTSGAVFAMLPTLTAVKVMLYQGMRE